MGDPRKKCPEKCPRIDLDIESPRLRGEGSRQAKIILVGEAPGQNEDLKGRPFIGESGKILDNVFAELDIDRDDVYITNAVKCATPVENKKPGKKELAACRKYLQKEIEKINPNVVGCMGAVALEAVLQRTGITKLQNNVFESEEFGVKVVPVLHPAYILRNPGAYRNLQKGMEIIRQESYRKEKVKYTKVKTNHVDASTPRQIDKVLSQLEKRSRFTFDLETTSLNPIEAKIILIALSWQKGLGITIKWKSLSKKQKHRLQKIFLSKKTKIGHNLKFDIQVLWSNKIRIKGPFFDTLPAMALINENIKDKTLEALTLRYLDLGEYWKPLDEFKEAYLKKHKMKKEDFRYTMIPYKILCEYAQGDADATHRLYLKFKWRLEHNHDLIVFYNKYVLPTLKVITQVEYRGIKVNRKRLAKLIVKQKKEVAKAAEAIKNNKAVKKYQKIRYANASKGFEEKWKKSKTLRSRFPDVQQYIKKRIKDKDWHFNPRSPKQLSEMLFGMLKLPSVKKTTTGQESTDEEVLNILANNHKVDIAIKIIEHRKVSKFLSTYLESVYEKSAIDGRIHPNYLQHRAVTGRLSSENPNFQNIPRDAKEFKRCFVADPGMIIVKADLAQAEFRCWAHYSKDAKMIADIESGMDIHRKTASEVFGVPEEEVTKDQRTAAKNCVFGLMYGRGVKAIAAQYGISEEDATEVRELFFKNYPDASIWLDKQVKFAEEYKFVQTWMGRIRRLPEIESDEHMAKAEAERQAKNSPIQGLASDMNNHFMVMNLKLAKKKGIKCYPFGTIHDANLIQVKKSDAKKLIKVMKTVVNTAFPDFRCKMVLDFEVGKTLGTLKEI
jgi:DNA polymerase-1